MANAKDASSLALRRLQRFIAPKKESAKAVRDIRLGLDRISRVVPEVQQWQGVHVGGTNGKGSICAFLSGLFTLGGIGYGRFVSPAFPHKHNAVTINGKYVNPRVYEVEADNVRNAYQRLLQGWQLAAAEDPGPLSPFELETATAFRIFNRTGVPYGIVEVGMGGATDATNAMRRKGVTVISKIDLDHQEYLGRTLEQIAKVKAGIMRPGVPCIVDYTNEKSVIRVLREHANSIGTQISLSWKAEPLLSTLDNDRWKLEDYQKQNLLCAALAFRHLFPLKPINLDRLLETEPYLPGRLEWVGIDKLTDDQYKAPVLVDAAHNPLGVQALARYVDTNLRSEDAPITWVIGFSSSSTKPFDQMIKTLVRPQDNVAFVEFDQQSNEPPPTPAAHGQEVLRTVISSTEQVYQGEPNLRDALHWAASKAGAGRLVITGSLYLVRDFYMLDGVHRFRGETRTQQPTSSQLWRLEKLRNERALTQEEHEEFKQAKWLLHESKLNNAMDKIKGTNKRLKESPASKKNPQPKASLTAADDPAGLVKLRNIARRHRYQLRGYRIAIRSIGNDIDQETQAGGELSSDILSKLREDAELLKAQADKHYLALEDLLDRFRNHPDAPKIFGPRLEETLLGKSYAGSEDSPFNAATELDVKEEPAESEKEEALSSRKGHEATTDKPAWLIADFQRGESPTFVEHARAGVRLLAEHGQDAILAYSGGPTRGETRLSEAQSYFNIALENAFWGYSIPEGQIILEERALDSYHNVLFSLTLFFSRFGVWPRHMTIVSHAFKRPRLIDGHCVAIGWPLGRASFVGIDPPGLAGKEDAVEGAARAIGEWLDDPHGRGASLKGKRAKRNPWGVSQGIFEKGVEASVRENAKLSARGESDDETLEDTIFGLGPSPTAFTKNSTACSTISALNQCPTPSNTRSSICNPPTSASTFTNGAVNLCGTSWSSPPERRSNFLLLNPRESTSADSRERSTSDRGSSGRGASENKNPLGSFALQTATRSRGKNLLPRNCAPQSSFDPAALPPMRPR
ncbi:unnamed protein product [Clonostachys rhizophaga]|uniref:DUF218 domain-containing protein n=1 Tax=Clonostachys rhizophaga TaxID=160324 RepID=A0A9N9V6P5_9HYPO|nr:unnamed protein product [Clonostachys rhizophaga]